MAENISGEEGANNWPLVDEAGQALTNTELEPGDPEEWENLPNRRQSLRAIESRHTVFISFAVAQQDTECSECGSNIGFGDSYVRVNRITSNRDELSRKIDFGCLKTRLLPHLSNIQVIKAKEASTRQIIKKARRHRSNQSRKRAGSRRHR